MNRFRLDGQHLFLTIPQTDTTKETALQRLQEHYKENIIDYIIAQEDHQDGNKHLHIYIKLDKRFTTTKNTYFNFIADKQGNYQIAKKPTEVIDYISKGDNYITNIDITTYNQQRNKHTTRTSKGIYKQIVESITKDTEYSDIMKKYPDICLQHGNKIKQYIQDYKLLDKPKYRNWEMNVEYHYGDTGTGKSRYAFTDYNPETHYVLRKSNGENNVWWDGYTGQETIIIDDFTPKSYRLSYMLNLLDRYAMSIDYKGGATQLLAKTIIITSNYKPEDLYTGENCTEHRKAFLRRINKMVEYKSTKIEIDKETQYKKGDYGIKYYEYGHEKYYTTTDDEDNTEEEPDINIPEMVAKKKINGNI